MEIADHRPQADLERDREITPSAAAAASDGETAGISVAEWQRLVRLAYVIVGDRSAAEDLVQEACLRLHRARGRVDNPAGFVRTALVNLCKTYTVRRSRERASTDPVPSIVTSPEIDETWTALSRLRPKHRTVLALRYYDDLPVEAIATMLGIRLGTAKSLIHRALEALRRELERTGS